MKNSKQFYNKKKKGSIVYKKLIISLITITFVSSGCGGDGTDKVNINKNENQNIKITDKLLTENEDGKIIINLNKKIDNNTKNELNIFAIKQKKVISYIDKNGNTISVGNGQVLSNGDLLMDNGDIIKKTYSYKTNDGAEYILENGKIYRIEIENGIQKKFFISEGYIDNNGNLQIKSKNIIAKIESNLDLNTFIDEDNIIYKKLSNEEDEIGKYKYLITLPNGQTKETFLEKKVYEENGSYKIKNENSKIVEMYKFIPPNLKYNSITKQIITIDTNKVLYENVTLDSNGNIATYVKEDKETIKNLTDNPDNFTKSYLDENGDMYYEFDNQIRKQNLKTGKIENLGSGVIANNKIQLANEEHIPISIKMNSNLPAVETLVNTVYTSLDTNDKYINIDDKIYVLSNGVYNYLGKGTIENNKIMVNSNIIPIEEQAVDNNSTDITSKGTDGFLYKVVGTKLYKKGINDSSYNLVGNGAIDSNGTITNTDTGKIIDGTIVEEKNIKVGRTATDIEGNLYANIDGNKIKLDTNLNLSYLENDFDINAIANTNNIISKDNQILMSNQGMTEKLDLNNGAINKTLIASTSVFEETNGGVKLTNNNKSELLNIGLIKTPTYNINGEKIESEMIDTKVKNSNEKIELDYNIIKGEIVIDMNNSDLKGNVDYDIKGEGTISLDNGSTVIDANKYIDSETTKKSKNESPSIISVIPDENNLLLIGDIIRIYFNKEILPSSATSYNISLLNNKNQKSNIKVSIGQPNEIIISPIDKLERDMNYTLKVNSIKSKINLISMNSEYTKTIKTSTDEVLKIIKVNTTLGNDNLSIPTTNISIKLNYDIEKFNNANDGYIRLVNANDLNDIIPITVTQPNSDTILVDPDKTLKNNTTYLLFTSLIESLDAKGVAKEASNLISIGSDNMTKLINSVPLNNSVNYIAPNDLILYYNNPLKSTVGNLSWMLSKKGSQDKIKLTAIYDSTNYSIRLIVPPTIETEQDFVLTIPPIEDENENILPTELLNFKSADITPPEIIENGTVPEINDAEFDFNQPISVTFSEPIKSSTVTNTTFYITEKDTGNLITGPTISVSGNTILMDASNQLKEYTDYELHVTKGITDLSDNNYTVDKIINFKSYDITPPQINVVTDVLQTSAWDLTNGISTSFKFVMSEEVRSINNNNVYVRPVANYNSPADNVDISINYEQVAAVDKDGTTYYIPNKKVVIVKLKQLIHDDYPNNKYYLVIDGVEDLSGNLIRGKSVKLNGSDFQLSADNLLLEAIEPTVETNTRYLTFFQSGDNTRPYVTSVNQVAGNYNAWDVDFDDDVLVDTALPTSFKIEDGNDSYQLMDTSFAKQVADKTWRVTLNSPLKCNTFMRFRITDIYDFSYNKLASGSNQTATDTDTGFQYKKCYKKTCTSNYTGVNNYTSGSTNASTTYQYAYNVRYIEAENSLFYKYGDDYIYKIYPDGTFELMGIGSFSTTSSTITFLDGSTFSSIVAQKDSANNTMFFNTSSGKKEVPNFNFSVNQSAITCP